MAGETRRTQAREEAAPQSTEATTMEKRRERKSAQRMRFSRFSRWISFGCVG